MSAGLELFRKKLYFAKFHLLFNKGMKKGKISRFDDEIFEKMNGTIIACLPVSLYIKYSNYLFHEGTCYDRSLYMFLALEDALLVRGNSKVLEYQYGKEHDGHGWIEIGDYVYDPSLMLKFDKNIYYALYGCNNVNKIDKETYMLQHKDFVSSHISSDFDEFRPGGKRRLDLGILVVQIKALSQFLDDKEFTKDFNEYLACVDYNEEQIYEERHMNLQRILTNKSMMNIISGNEEVI